MTADDHEKHGILINPYITIFSPESAWVHMNTSTFGEEGQRELISIHSETLQERLEYEGKHRLYRVVATIAKQDHPFDWESRRAWGRGVRVTGISDPIATVPMGYLLEGFVKEHFPKCFEYFENVRMEKDIEEGLESKRLSL